MRALTSSGGGSCCKCSAPRSGPVCPVRTVAAETSSQLWPEARCSWTPLQLRFPISATARSAPPAGPRLWSQPLTRNPNLQQALPQSPSVDTCGGSCCDRLLSTSLQVRHALH